MRRVIAFVLSSRQIGANWKASFINGKTDLVGLGCGFNCLFEIFPAHDYRRQRRRQWRRQLPLGLAAPSGISPRQSPPLPSNLISLCLQTKNRPQCGANNVASVKFRILELGPLFRLFLQHHGSRFVVLDRSRLSERAHWVTLSVSLTQSSPPVAVLQAKYRKQGRKETLIYCI